MTKKLFGNSEATPDRARLWTFLTAKLIFMLEYQARRGLGLIISKQLLRLVQKEMKL